MTRDAQSCGQCECCEAWRNKVQILTALLPTCGTCRHFVPWFPDGVTMQQFPETRGDCRHRSYAGRRNGQSPDDGCIKGWEAREGER
jgi:hypothetical protein